MRNRTFAILMVCTFFVVESACAQETHYLPQVVNGVFDKGSFRTTFILFNNNNTSTTAILKLSDDSGSPFTVTIPGFGTDSQFTINLDRRASRILQTDGTSSLAVGAATVTSSPLSIGVSAIFTIYDLNSNFVTEAGVGSSQPMTEFVMPVDATGFFNTGVALFNQGSTGASVTLILRDTTGSEVARTTLDQLGLNLGAGAHLAHFVAGQGQFFPSVRDMQGTLTVQSSVPISALTLRQNSSAPLPTYTSLPVVQKSSTQRSVYLPHVANGTDGNTFLKTSFLICNISSTPAVAILTLTQDNGLPFVVTLQGSGRTWGTNSSFSVPLAAGASAFLQSDGSGPLASGSATITSNAPVGGEAIFTVLNSQNQFLAETGVGGSPLLTSLTLPVDITPSADTGVAFFNPGDRLASLTMMLLDTDGVIVDTNSTHSLSPKTHAAKFVSQIFPGRERFRGTLAVSASAPVAALTLRQNSSPLSFTTLPTQTDPSVLGDAPSRTTFIDLGYSTYNFVNGVGRPGFRISLYDPINRLFFVSVTYGNEVVVVSPVSERIIARIPVPQPYGMDFSLDGRTLYVATGTDFLYVIDPVKLQVADRIDISYWGGRGFSMAQPFMLAGGKIGFLNQEYGIFIWNPADEFLQWVLGRGPWAAIRSKDGTKIAYNTIGSPAEIGIIDVGSGKIIRGDPGAHGFVTAFHPTKNQFLVMAGSTAEPHAALYDENLNIVMNYPIPSVISVDNGFFSRDGSQVFLDGQSNITVAVLDASSFKLKGYIQEVDPSAPYFSAYMQDIDETGLAVGASHQGVSLLDTRRLFSQPPGFGMLFGYPGHLNSGSVTGGTVVQLYGYAYGSFGGSIAGAQIFFGALPASDAQVSITSSGSTTVEATAPANLPGTVNIGVYLPNGAMTMAASAFTYGPTIRDPTFTASTAEGGPAALYGYGLGKGAKVLVGNGSSAGTPTDKGFVYSPDLGQMSKLDYQIPPGSPGRADLTLQTGEGTSVYRNYMHYYPPISKYPLPGPELRIGLYDASRKLVYFTQSDRVAIFSVASRSWLVPITLPASSNPREVRFAALSPQAGYLAITDAGTGSLIVIDLAKKSVLREVSLGPPGISLYPPQIAYPVVFESETKVYTIAVDELRLSDVTNGDAIWRQQLTFVPEITPYTKIFLDATGRYLFFDRGTYYDLNENLYPTEVHYWGCAETWQGAELSISPDGRISHAGCVLDSSLRVTSQVYYSAAQFYSADSRHGRTWDPSGTYIFQATSAGVDVIDAKTGGVKERIAIPVSNPDSTPSLILDPDDRLLFIVTSEGVSALDVHDLPIGINSVDPASGPAGSLVAIRGNGFDANTQIIVDGKVVDAVFVDAYMMKFSAPDHADGPAQIRVKASDGSQDSLDAAFVYHGAPGVASAGHAAEGVACCHRGPGASVLAPIPCPSFSR